MPAPKKEKERERAFNIYKETKSARIAGEKTGIHPESVRRWIRNYRWDIKAGFVNEYMSKEGEEIFDVDEFSGIRGKRGWLV